MQSNSWMHTLTMHWHASGRGWCNKPQPTKPQHELCNTTQPMHHPCYLAVTIYIAGQGSATSAQHSPLTLLPPPSTYQVSPTSAAEWPARGLGSVPNTVGRLQLRASRSNTQRSL